MRHFALRLIAVSICSFGGLRAAEPTLTLEQALASVEGANLNVLLSRERDWRAARCCRRSRERCSSGAPKRCR
jgi:hypothetical protein